MIYTRALCLRDVTILIDGLLYALRFRLKPNMLFCYVCALWFCYVNPVASHVCDVNPDVDLECM